jgi:hypothetical protein
MNSKRIRAALAATAVLCGMGAAEAQFGNLGRAARGLGINAPVPNALRGQEPISTSIRDATWGDPSKDGFVPPMPRQSLHQLGRTPDGGFTLAAGYYVFHNQSYCLHAGTHGPGGPRDRGDGYLYAPPRGTAEDAVMTIVRGSVAHPEIGQRDIQTLLWAIVARAKFEDLSPEHQAIAAQLLTRRQLATLNRSALGTAMGLVGGNLPEPLRSIAQAEARLRSLLSVGGGNYAELERVAVLNGPAPVGPGSQPVPAGRWSQHPDGYWVRYQPQGYTNTIVSLWVPPGSAGVGKVYDPATHIAVPGNTYRQRLIQSGRAYR